MENIVIVMAWLWLCGAGLTAILLALFVPLPKNQDHITYLAAATVLLGAVWPVTCIVLLANWVAGYKIN